MPRFSIGCVLWSAIALYVLLNVTIIGVIWLPNVIANTIMSLARAGGLALIRQGESVLVSGPRQEFLEREFAALFLFMLCILSVAFYHRPLYRYFRLRKRSESVSPRLAGIARKRLLKSAQVTALLVFVALTVANIYFFTGNRDSSEFEIMIGADASDSRPRVFHMEPKDIGRKGTIGDTLHVVPLSIMIQILITLYVYYQQNHRVKSHYYHHVFDREAIHVRPKGMKRSSIRLQIWTANALTTLLPLILVLIYFFVFLTVREMSSISREELTVLMGRYASLVGPGELGDVVTETMAANSDIPIFNTLIYFTPIDTLLLIAGLSIGILVIVTYSYYLSKWSIQDITSPLKELQRNIKKSADGDLSHLTPVRSNNEIGELTENFNHMIENLKQAERLESAKAAAEAANRAKSAFLANMSHELRTPLNAILGFTQIMSRDSNLTPDQLQNLSTINRSGEHLLDLINDVLDISKIESGRTSLNPTNFDFHYLIDGIEEMFVLRAEKQGLSLLVERSDDLPRYLFADENKLRQILMNLMSNAVKFTKEGGISARIGVREADNSTYRLQFEIEDSGPGIASEEIETLFEPFVQSKTGRNAQEGTGLGLPICRNFVDMMGGTISVQSTLGEGSLFTFDIVAETGDEDEVLKSRPRRVTGIKSVTPEMQTGGRSDVRLLIVEDRETNRLLLRKILSPFGFELREAVNGEEAIAIWSEWEPQLIFMDMQMPIMNGHEATKRIKATTRGQATVIIALTASAFEDERALILSEGCDDFIRKPFRENEIYEKLESHLGIEFIYEDLAETPVELERPESVQLDKDAMAVLPGEWRQKFRAVTIAGDMDAILSLIEEVRGEYPQLAGGLSILAHEFDYQSILELLPVEQPS